MITIQYLEPGDHIAEITPDQCRKKLQAAFNRLPIDGLLVGWDIPAGLEDVCREITTRFGAKLYRWHPLLTGDGTLYPEVAWRTRNHKGLPLSGFRNLPEFTFICPNNPESRTQILINISRIVQSGRYDGIFLDRMGYPSPTADPVNLQSCFCEYCQMAARKVNLDLEEIHKMFIEFDSYGLVHTLFDGTEKYLHRFLDFRQRMITEFIFEITSIIRSGNLAIGLDCFSPSLARMVGQDLKSLTPLADWTKTMIYGHAFGPATLPFELTDLLTWLRKNQGIEESMALTNLLGISSLPITKPLRSLQNVDISSGNLATEYEFGKRMAGSSTLLAGIELVEISGVSELNSIQIDADIRALKAVDAGGLSISWDLWHIPLDRLDIVSSAWFS
jgi:hypothetical protein